MKILLIVNASASSVTARGRVVIQKALSADHDVRVAATSRRGHATRLAQGAAASGTDVVVVLGGDGTLNEAANGLAGTATALAPLPGGSTNVFARTLGLSDDPVDATATLLEALSMNAIRAVGLGSVNGRYFLFHTGVGYDAAVVAQVERRAGLKRYAGHPLFMWSAITTWLRHYDHRSPAFALHYPDGTVVDTPFAIVLNTNPYTYLGARPFDVAPDAGLQKPLAVVALTSMGLLTLGRVAAAALRSGSGLGASKHVHYQPNVFELTVRGHRPFPYQVDGDHLGDAEELVMRYEPEVLSLVVPDARAISR